MISVCGNLVPTSPHTDLGETLVHAMLIDAKRAISVGICLVKLTLNLSQDPVSQNHLYNPMVRGPWVELQKLTQLTQKKGNTLYDSLIIYTLRD